VVRPCRACRAHRFRCDAPTETTRLAPYPIGARSDHGHRASFPGDHQEASSKPAASSPGGEAPRESCSSVNGRRDRVAGRDGNRLADSTCSRAAKVTAQARLTAIQICRSALATATAIGQYVRVRFARRYVVAVVSLTLLAGCSGGSHHTAHPPTPPTPSLVHARPAVTTRLEFQSNVVGTGRSLVGALVVDNKTRQPIRSPICSSWEVQLTNQHVPIQHIVVVEKCAPGPVFSVGSHRYTFTVEASYRCGPAPPPGPSCVNGGPLPLPTGDYRAVLVQGGTTLPPPAPISVHVAYR
jgi:hypothetical protein